MKTTRKNLVTAISTAAVALSLSPAASALNIALSNDDGWEAPGIQAMRDALISAFHDVTLAAPLGEQSGSSAAVNTGGGDLWIVKETDAPNPQFSVATTQSGGTDSAEPASSALVAINIADNPDLVVTGINSGANIGSFTQVSGTVGGTIVSLSNTFNQAVPAIAISTNEPCDVEELEDMEAPEEEIEECLAENEAHYINVAEFVVDFIDHLQTKPGFLAGEENLLPAGIGLNINYPPTDDIKGIRVARQSNKATFPALAPFPLAVQFGCYGLIPGQEEPVFDGCADAPVGTPILGGIAGATPDSTEPPKDGDTELFDQGYITIVPIQADYTSSQYRRFKSVVNSFE